jgi:hypothetical protein
MLNVGLRRHKDQPVHPLVGHMMEELLQEDHMQADCLVNRNLEASQQGQELIET